MSSSNISITDVSEKFDRHLNIRDNYNILFSGKYGMGKTYFLNGYFKERPTEYNAFFISPVNYVVSSNEDVFELIKVDILKQLFINNKLQLEESIGISKVNAIKKFGIKYPVSIIKNLSKALSNLSISAKVLSATASGIDELINDFSKFEQEINEEVMPSSQRAENYINSFMDREGSHVEFNIISDIINKTLIDASKNGSSNVLIIDDLDRLDPEHIFRLLNVFSAHNIDDGLNKFGFDKIIIVLDLENLRNVFSHVYGANTNFDGYIDKFYSVKPFYFNNVEAVCFYVEESLDMELGDDELMILTCLLSYFIEKHHLSVRKLFKVTYGQSREIQGISLFDISNHNIRHSSPLINCDKIYIDTGDINLIDVVKYLDVIVGGVSQLRDLIEKCIKLEEMNDTKELVPLGIRERFVKSFAIASHIASHLRKESLFINTKNRVDYPEGRLWGNSYKIQFMWSSTNPYKGDKSFFQMSNVIVTNESSQLEYLAVLKTLGKFVEFCEIQRLL